MVRTNADLEKMVETSDEWITERTGIKERRIAAEGDSVMELHYIVRESVALFMMVLQRS